LLESAGFTVLPVTADGVPDAALPDLVVCLLGGADEPPQVLLRWAAAQGIPIISDPRALAAYTQMPVYDASLEPLPL
jgi:hypothetical protein